MGPLIFDWLHEWIMPHPERDDRARLLKRFALIGVISVFAVFFFGQ